MLHVKCILFSWPSAELINLLEAEGSIESCIQGSLQELSLTSLSKTF